MKIKISEEITFLYYLGIKIIILSCKIEIKIHIFKDILKQKSFGEEL